MSMKKSAGLGFFLWVAVAATFTTSAEETALDRYVAAADPAYSYRLVQTIPGKEFKTHVLEMTSQSWLTPNEVNRTVWRHWLTLVEPEQVESNIGLLFITGGSNESPAPKSATPSFAAIAAKTKSIVAELRMVPNQPLVFKDDGQPRSEDALIAYTWDKFLRTGDEKWPARLPMTKSAVRAMDTITSFSATADGGKHKVDRFVVAGGSKRGWTTWTTAAVDKRVVSIVPIVIDMLNLEPSFIHHWEAYGFYAPAVHDYEENHVMDWQQTPEFRALLKLVEPYSYRERFTMPKFLINATGDQFFLPDSAQFYFKDLPGVKYLRYVPNADHSLKNTDATESLAAWYAAILKHGPLPKFSWTAPSSNIWNVRVDSKPSAVKLWQATNPEARDFRLETLGPVWTSSDLAQNDAGSYEGKVSVPEKGWRAFMVELTFANPNGPAPFKFTTPVKVVPDILPYHFQPKPRPERAGR